MSTKLPAGASSGRTQVEYQKVYVLHGQAPIYTPAPGGGTYCNTATCTHWHQDNEAGKRAADECSARLARMIERGTLPDWATTAYPIV